MGHFHSDKMKVSHFFKSACVTSGKKVHVWILKPFTLCQPHDQPTITVTVTDVVSATWACEIKHTENTVCNKKKLTGQNVHALPSHAIAEIYSVWENHLCLTVWNTNKIWKVKSGFIKKPKKQKHNQLPPGLISNSFLWNTGTSA